MVRIRHFTGGKESSRSQRTVIPTTTLTMMKHSAIIIVHKATFRRLNQNNQLTSDLPYIVEMVDTDHSSTPDKSTTRHIGRRRFLGGAVGAASAAIALPAITGVAAAHFPAELDIDVQPDNEDNYVDFNKHDHVSVAVLPSTFLNSEGKRETFDPTEQDVRYRFGSRSALDDGEGARPAGNGKVTKIHSGHGNDAESVNAVALQFPINSTGLDNENDVAWLYWERDESGEHGYAGFDTVTVVGNPVAQDLLAFFRNLLQNFSR